MMEEEEARAVQIRQGRWGWVRASGAKAEGARTPLLPLGFRGSALRGRRGMDGRGWGGEGRRAAREGTWQHAKMEYILSSYCFTG